MTNPITEDEKMLEQWLNHLQDEDSTGAWNDNDTRIYGKILQALSLEKRVRELVNEDSSKCVNCKDGEEHFHWQQKLQQLLGEQL